MYPAIMWLSDGSAVPQELWFLFFCHQVSDAESVPDRLSPSEEGLVLNTKYHFTYILYVRFSVRE